MRIDNEKKHEYEFLTENLRKKLISVERENEELKCNYFDFENKLKITKEANNNLTEEVETKSKNIKLVTNQLEDYENIISELRYK